MNSLIDNAQRIFDVAQSASACAGHEEDRQDFALLVKPDGGLHFVMECEFSLEGAASEAGAQSAYRITRSRNGVRVQGRAVGAGGVFEQCLLERKSVARELFCDQPCYQIAASDHYVPLASRVLTSPLLTAGLTSALISSTSLW